MPFLFVWSTLLVTPLIMSTGMIGIAQYLAHFWHTSAALSHWEAVGFTILTVALLWRRIDSIGKLAKVLRAGMSLTVGLVIVGAFTHFSARQAFTFPHGAFGFNHFFSGLGAGLVLAIFDYLGYYTIAYLGDETHNPGRVIPRSIVISVLGVMVIDLAFNIGTMGVIPWQQAEKLVGWIYIFHGSGWPPIRIMIGWTVAGIIAYIIWAKVNRLWPFGPKEIHAEFLAAPAGNDTTSTTNPTASAAEPVAR